MLFLNNTINNVKLKKNTISEIMLHKYNSYRTIALLYFSEKRYFAELLTHKKTIEIINNVNFHTLEIPLMTRYIFFKWTFAESHYLPPFFVLFF